jgi:hypothetical protein
VWVGVPLFFAQSRTKINTPTIAPPHVVVKKAACIILNVLYNTSTSFEKNVHQRVQVEKNKRDFNKTLLYDCSFEGGLEIASG